MNYIGWIDDRISNNIKLIFFFFQKIQAYFCNDLNSLLDFKENSSNTKSGNLLRLFATIVLSKRELMLGKLIFYLTYSHYQMFNN